MDSNQFGSSILIFIETNFPGGLVGFTQQGGLVCASPFDSDSILIYHPEMPEQFVECINAFNSNDNIKFIVLDDINFPGVDPKTIMTQLYGAGNEIKDRYQIPVVLFNPMCPLLLMISIPLVTLSVDIISDILNIFSSKVDGVVRGCLNVGGVPYLFSSSKESIPKTEPERGDITAKTVADIKATLANDLDVLEFIKML
jgi:hypothetical protein